MRKFAYLFIAALVLAAPLTAQTGNSPRLFTQVEPILDGLHQITGFPVRRKVPSDYITKDKLNDFIQQRIREVVKPEDIRIESLALKMFGFLPEDYDLKSAIVELLTEQAAAFYDYDRKRLFITESDSSFLEKRAALVHELAHALADQSYPLGKFMRKGINNDDAATAREAVVEGQATWLMWAYVSHIGGGEAKVSKFVLDSMKGAASEAVGSQYPVFEKAPLYLRESLVFPYTAGLQFQDAIFEEMGKSAFAEVFRRPPVSTQQVLHPQLYLLNQRPTEPRLPSVPDAKSYRKLADGTVGELDFQLLLRQYAGDYVASRVSPKWRGGQFKLYETKRTARPLLTFAAEWDTPAAAKEFFDAYRTVLEKKWSSTRFDDEQATRLSGTGDRGRFVVTLNGPIVTSIEGLP
jgi:hypothetical protein